MIHLYLRRHNFNKNADKLFFIKYTPKRTLRSQCYLVQVKLTSALESDPNAKEHGIYYCIFLSKHPDDQGKSDEFSRW